MGRFLRVALALALGLTAGVSLGYLLGRILAQLRGVESKADFEDRVRQMRAWPQALADEAADRVAWAKAESLRAAEETRAGLAAEAGRRRTPPSRPAAPVPSAGDLPERRP